MGYCTKYSLKVPKKSWSESLEEVLNDDSFCDYSPLVDFVLGAETCKWYGHEVDMRRLSLIFPEVLFTLVGEGEEPGDLWIKYFQDGKMQHCPAEIFYPDFNPEKLE